MSRAFDHNRPFWVSPDAARLHLQDAWLCQFAGQRFLSKLIMKGTQGVHSHSAMVRRNNGTIDVLEMIEWHGGRIKTLEFHLGGRARLDCFSPCQHDIAAATFNAKGATEAMRVLCDEEYGRRGLLRMALRRCPILWHLYPPTTVDRLPTDDDPIRQPFCSHAVALACQLGGGFDVVQNAPNWLVCPMDLTKSLFWGYEFSIATPWAVAEYEIDMTEILRNDEELTDGTR